jgi:hypothetical protein
MGEWCSPASINALTAFTAAARMASSRLNFWCWNIHFTTSAQYWSGARTRAIGESASHRGMGRPCQTLTSEFGREIIAVSDEAV